MKHSWLLVGMAVAAACRAAPPAESPSAVTRPGAQGRDYLARAHRAWLEAFRAGDALSYEESLELLRRAQESDPGVPLTWHLEGSVRLDRVRWGAEQPDPMVRARDLQEAEAAFDQALGLAPEWLPGHLGQVDVALEQGLVQPAQRALDEAFAALARLTGVADPAPDELARMQAPLLRGEARSGAEDARDVLLSQMQETEHWRPDHRGGAELLDGADAMERLAGRLALARARVRFEADRRTGDPRAARVRLLDALEKDVMAGAEIVEAKIERARASAGVDLIEPALADLEYVVGGTYPLLRGCPTLADELAALRLQAAQEYARIWRLGGDRERWFRAKSRLEALLEDGGTPEELDAPARQLYVQIVLEYERGAGEGRFLENAEHALLEGARRHPEDAVWRRQLDVQRLEAAHVLTELWRSREEPQLWGRAFRTAVTVLADPETGAGYEEPARLLAVDLVRQRAAHDLAAWDEGEQAFRLAADELGDASSFSVALAELRLAAARDLAERWRRGDDVEFDRPMVKLKELINGLHSPLELDLEGRLLFLELLDEYQARTGDDRYVDTGRAVIRAGRNRHAGQGRPEASETLKELWRAWKDR